MNSNLLEIIENWFIETRDSNRYASVSIDTPMRSCVNTDNPGMYVDAETATELARITVWASQECDLEIISKHTGETILYERIRIDENNYKENCTAFFSKLCTMSG